MSDLFSDKNMLHPLPLRGAEVFYARYFDLGQDPICLMQRLIVEVPWRAENVVVWGKSYPQPRLIAWFGDAGRGYQYSGVKLNPLPWSALLLSVKRRVEQLVGVDFNSVLLNYYRDNRDSMGFHSDEEKELGKRPIIASLSLGQGRVFILKSKQDTAGKSIKLKLESGSLLLMKGDTQKNWKHGIEKEKRPCGPRVNLTFRRINADDGLVGK
ncbi:alpha-ketoglutarate-dependent dioxygenase AlkB family protein [Rhodopila sp.]|uniref:alpha-ketoglutarate-dependent dioxygenase AlkB family protein n=1 Tax=Rhodopila sp. TaxID=2480087 RepID=UPI003D0E1F2B